MICHRMDLFLSRSVTLALVCLEIVTKRYDAPLKADSVDIIFQHRLRLSSLYIFNKKSL